MNKIIKEITINGFTSKNVFSVDLSPLEFNLKIEVDNNKNNNKFSFFSANGVGKSSIVKFITQTLYKPEKYKFGVFSETIYFNDNRYYFNNPKSNRLKLLKKNFHVYSITNKLNSKFGLFLPEEARELLIEHSFSRNLNSPFIDNYLLPEEYREYEKKIDNINVAHLSFQKDQDLGIVMGDKTNLYKFNEQYLCSNISILAQSIEILSAFLKIPVDIFLKRIKKNEIPEIDDISPNDSLLKDDLLKNFKVLVENKNICDFYLKLYYKIKNKKTISILKNQIELFNDRIQKIFPELKKIFYKYFSNSFKDIVLNERYNSSIGCYIFDLHIYDYFDNEFSLEKFLNKIGSEGEKKLINFICLYVELKIFDSKDLILIADDSLDSFDNLNSINILNFLDDLIREKNFIFFIFTHDYELFKIANNIFNIEQKKIFLLSRNKKNRKINFVNFPIRKNFYTDYLIKINKNKIEEQILLLVSLIPYYRGIIEISEGPESEKYLLATSFLHHKKNESFDLQLLFNEFLFKKFNFISDENKKRKIIDFLKINKKYDALLEKIYEDIILDSKNDINMLEYRLFVSVYARILIESWVVKYLKENKNNFDPKEIKKLQMKNLLSQFEKFAYELENEDLIELNKSFYSLNKLLPGYIHSGHNDLSYLINIDSNMLINSINSVRKNISLIKKKS